MKLKYKIPWISFRWRYIDTDRWYYVFIDGEEMLWWALENELKDISERYGKDKVKFKKVPWFLTILF